ncbi:hypothetical protein ACNI65_14265 [Roseateles sp. So40a]|uniref:hypothetical protein n=1 Tax=Roseateles sp. So40a TaxID=3400226 RepID=UPI003A869421
MRQVIDSTRLFKEKVRVDRALTALGGSMFWKAVGDYEYLVQRQGRKLIYLGPRTSSMQARHDGFLNDREQLKQRSSALHQSVGVAQRMNRAVRAGVTPVAFVDALNQIELLGLSGRCMVLGPAALLVYAQAAGVSGYAAPSSALVHVALTAVEASEWTPKLRVAMRRQARVDVVDLGGEDGLLLHVRRDESDLTALPGGRRQPLARAEAQRLAGTMRVIRNEPALEHVVIGTTGKMAPVRAVDPGVYALLAQQQDSHTLPVIERMLEQHMVAPLSSADRYEQLKQQLQGMEEGTGLAIA